ncbi:MAG TPA: mechanosensitive ion channel [Nitrospirales bacterium]|nr:mechanosensitive ion channel [Nitrospirales bacterium]
MSYFEPYISYIVAALMPIAIKVLIILLVFYVLAKTSRKVILGVTDRLNIDDHLVAIFARTSNITVIIFASVAALGTMGINVSALVASLGLTGFALGFALKDTISNFISGILILLYRPFEIGDCIRILGYEGIVVAIDLRYTEIDSEGNKVLIPNSKLFSDPITVLQSSATGTS